ncbi:hypothetical protein HYQ46_011396 [Verticillium longisporum]|nr:hypothetical protein HYQ46_011396 [Verticillium longisporum]
MVLDVVEVTFEDALELLLELGWSEWAVVAVGRRAISAISFSREIVRSSCDTIFLNSLPSLSRCRSDAKNIPAEGFDEDDKQRQVGVFPIRRPVE